MIRFFRQSSRNWVSVAILGVVLVAFIVTGAVTRGMSGDGGVGGDAVAKVGGEALTTAEVAKRIQATIEAARQRNPQLDNATFVAQGGVEQIVDQLISDKALEIWARRQGIGASKRLIDGEIASISAFRGLTGKFDPALMRSILAQRRVTENDLRADIASEAISRQVVLPASGAAYVPAGLVAPYAGLLLEEREGLVGAVPVAAVPAGPAPADAEVAAFYKANVARYMIPERRVLRYALIGTEQVKPSAPPSEAEIAAFYKANAATYAAKETRALEQAILPDQAAATAFAARAKGDFDAAAKGAGLAPADIRVGDVSQAQYAAKASPAVAAAVFAASSGALVGPVKADLGWYVVKVVSVKGTPARPLAAAHDEIAAAIQRQKADTALRDMVAAISDAVSGGSSFDDVVKSEKLAVATTPALTPDGAAPDDPAYRPFPEAPALLKGAQALGSDDEPTVETIAAGQRYALLSVAKVVPAVAAPLAGIRERVAADLVARRRAEAARRLAEGVVAAVKGGKPLAAALAEAKMPPPKPAKARQIDLAQARQAPPPLSLMFTMRKGDTKLLAAPGNAGWFVVQLTQVTAGDARTRPDLVDATRAQFARLVGQEYAEEITSAARAAVGVKRDPGAVARLKAGLVGASGGQ